MSKPRWRILSLRNIAELGFLSLFLNALMLVVPLYMIQVYDRIIPSNSLETLIYLSIIAAVALALAGFLDYARLRYSSRLAAQLDTRLGEPVFMASLRTGEGASGDVQPLRDLASLKAFVGSRAIATLFDLPFAPLFLAALWLIHPDFFLITASGLALLIAIALINQRLFAPSGAEAARLSRDAFAAAQAFARNTELIRALGMKRNAETVWGETQANSAAIGDDAAGINAGLGGFSKALRFGLQLAILGFGAYLVLRQEISPSMIFASSIVAGRAIQPIDQLIGSWPQLVAAQQARQRLIDTLASDPRDREKFELAPPVGALALEDVSYAVNTGGTRKYILRRITFSIKAGSVLAVVGPSGSGKSTLARLVAGAIDPASGVVRLDGNDLRNIDEEFRGLHTGYLPQSVELLPGTLAQNISRFEPDAPAEEIRKAAVNAQVDSLIKQLPEGYDTWVSGSGNELSGGQRQRIGLARAFYRNPALIILDEPNSSLDEEGDKALARAVGNAKKSGATVIIVTQRLRITSLADNVLEIIDGSISEKGPRDEVLARIAERMKVQAAKPARPDGKGANPEAAALAGSEIA